jgi:hypothetical protein
LTRWQRTRTVGARRERRLVVPRENTNVSRTLELVRLRDLIVVHEARPSLDFESSTWMEPGAGRQMLLERRPTCSPCVW